MFLPQLKSILFLDVYKVIFAILNFIPYNELTSKIKYLYRVLPLNFMQFCAKQHFNFVYICKNDR